MSHEDAKPTDHAVREVHPAKACSVCGNNISAAARKCIHCGSWQGFRAYIGASSTFLSLLVALVAVLGSTVPAIMREFTPDNSRLSFSFQNASAAAISVFVSNAGIRPGSLYEILFLEQRGDKNIEYALAPEGNEEQRAMMIRPGESLLLRLARATGHANVEPAANKKHSCDLKFFHTDFDGSRHVTNVWTDCTYLGAYIAAHDKI